MDIADNFTMFTKLFILARIAGAYARWRPFESPCLTLLRAGYVIINLHHTGLYFLYLLNCDFHGPSVLDLNIYHCHEAFMYLHPEDTELRGLRLVLPAQCCHETQSQYSSSLARKNYTIVLCPR